jgi:glycosyltransferase involved in cell wall biosynthesis
MKNCILVTTINVPTLLKDYALNASEHGRGDVEFIVVGDRKTPSGTAAFCAQVEQQTGCQFTYFDVGRQQDYLKRFPQLNQLIPWNSVQRRNVGLIYALEHGNDNIIVIDDDNYLIPGSDFIGEHITGLGTLASQKMVGTETGWFNCISMMQTNFGTVYPRGYALSKRWQAENWKFSDEIRRPVVNAGLWAGDPDIDALTRMYFPVETSLPLTNDYLTLAKSCWCPINTQNTTFHREAASVSFAIVMGYEFDGLKIARYCDIWMSWLLRTIVDHFGDAVRFGKPVVQQNRNQHNLLRDLREELPGMELNEALIEVCRNAKFTGENYLECYCELAGQIENAFATHRHAVFFRYLAEQMNTWAEAVKSVCPTGELAGKI